MECLESAHCLAADSNGQLRSSATGGGASNSLLRHGLPSSGSHLKQQQQQQQQQQQLEVGVRESCNGGQSEQDGSFTRDIISFSLYGKLSPKCKRPWNESLSSKIAKVQESFKNIPSMLYFSPSSVSFDGVGVYTAEALPQGTMLGPYFGRTVRREQIEDHGNCEWLWEVYEDSSLAYFIDASDPKYGNWMNLIQCARNQIEQNLKALQCNGCLYFEATKDIVVNEELLVWYDNAQYDLHMGIPTRHNGSNGPESRQLALHEAAMERTASNYHDYAAASDATQSPIHPPPPPPPPPLHSNLTRNGHSDGGTDDSGTDSLIETPPLPLEAAAQEVPAQQHTYSLLPRQNEPIRHTPDSPLPTTAYIEQPTSLWPTLPARAGPKVAEDSWPLKLVDPARSSSNCIYGMFEKTEDGTRWRCVECKRLFSSQGSLRAHARIHTGERPYQCQYCFRTFCQASTLRSHERLHTGEKPYKCAHCGRAFTQSAGLRSHQKTHRQDS